MGPGPLGPGKQTTKNVNMFTAPLLQWGRALSDPESLRRRVLPAGSQLASMGPGPLGPGKLHPMGCGGRGDKASMGPGPLGPGKIAELDSDCILIMLQWGRALSDPERRLRQDMACGDCLASMGPGPLGPGKGVRQVYLAQIGHASMGPGPLGPGKAAVAFVLFGP